MLASDVVRRLPLEWFIADGCTCERCEAKGRNARAHEHQDAVAQALAAWEAQQPVQDLKPFAWCGNSVYHDEFDQDQFDERCGACRRNLEQLHAALAGRAVVPQSAHAKIGETMGLSENIIVEGPDVRAGVPETPALLTYMETDSPQSRDAAFLRTYATRIRDGSASRWEIPSTVAGTVEAIAKRLEQAAAEIERLAVAGRAGVPAPSHDVESDEVVFSHQDCPFNYCDNPAVCKPAGQCRHRPKADALTEPSR